MPNKPNGFVFYRGPSMLDGKPIVAILTGTTRKSKNDKTGGGLFQTWILRADMNPLESARKGADISICGNCPARGTVARYKGKLKNTGRVCYVRLDTAPNGIWKCWRGGGYPTLAPADANALLHAIVAKRGGGKVRGGSYGDPTAVPFWVWQALLDGLDSGTAYTHQWRNFPEFAEFCMASVDNESERAHAKLLGFRTFRVRAKGAPLAPYEIDCPASEKMGYRTSCSDCVACGGHHAKAKCDVTIEVHAGRDKAFAAVTAPRVLFTRNAAATALAA